MFVARRIALALPTLLIVSLLVFFFMDMIPGDPAQMLAGPAATDEEVRSIREFLGLNAPLITRYGLFLKGLWDPSVATSFLTHRPVALELAERLPNTLFVALGGLALGLVLGTISGVICALRQGTLTEAILTTLTLTGISMPIYWLGLLGIWLFAVYLRWVPAAGASTPAHFILPILVIATRPTAMFSRLITTNLLEALSKDYVDTARAKGVSEMRVVLFHALRNSLVAAVSVAGVQFGGMLGGSVVTETVFGIPGVGRLLVDAVTRSDYPVIQYTILMFAFFFVAINLTTDLLTQWLDPRTRSEGKTT